MKKNIPAPKKKPVKKNIFKEWGVIVGALAVLVGTSAVGSRLALIWSFGLPTTYGSTVQQADLPEKYYAGDCTSDSMRAGVSIFLMPARKDGVDGQYVVGHYMIALYDRSVNTIAHEVSHFVDDMVAAKGIHDEETRAYMQGYFTQCVYDLARSKRIDK